MRYLSKFVSTEPCLATLYFKPHSSVVWYYYSCGKGLNYGSLDHRVACNYFILSTLCDCGPVFSVWPYF